MIISPERFDMWVKMELNVLLRGKHGVGKTHVILQECAKRGLNVQYFSTSTLDPWTDLCGIPRPKKIKVANKVEEYIDYVRPLLLQKDELDLVILDELNRSNKKVRNALMELIQFRSINGFKFNRLKNVIGIINPEDDKETYDIEPMDPAQLDRFQIQIDVPFAPDEDYFLNKFGANGRVGIEYWNNLTIELRDDVSPRRLDYALSLAKAGYKEHITDVLPHRVHPQKLIQALDSKSMIEVVEELVNAGNKKAINKWINVPNNFDNAIELITNNERYLAAFIEEIHPEKRANLIRTCPEVLKYVCEKFDSNPSLEKSLSDIGEMVVADVEREKSAKEAQPA